jgi:hypothetical protein
MKTKKGFHLRNVCGEYVIVAEGIENIDFSKIINMNESAAFLWKKIDGSGDFTTDDLGAYLCEEYDVDEATAKADAAQLVQQWIDAEIIEE